MVLIEKNKIKCPLCKNDITRFQGVFYVCPYCKRIINAELKEKTDRNCDRAGNPYTEYFVNEEQMQQVIKTNKRQLMRTRWYHWALFIIIGLTVVGVGSAVIVAVGERATPLLMLLAAIAIYGTYFFTAWATMNNKENHTYKNKNNYIVLRRFISKEYYYQQYVRENINELEKAPDVRWEEIKIDSIYRIDTFPSRNKPMITLHCRDEQGNLKDVCIENVFTPQEILEIFRKELIIESPMKNSRRLL